MALPAERAPALQAKARARARRARAAAARSHAAARRLGASVVIDGTAELDMSLVLGDLLRHPTARTIGFRFFGELPLCFSKQKLRTVARTIGAFRDLRCSVDKDALRFRWRHGRGGLNLTPLRSAATESLLLVCFAASRTATCSRESSAALLGDILHELGFPN